MKNYDYLIVGSGLYGAMFAYKAHQSGKKCLVIDKRKTCGGNLYCREVNGIYIHEYGAHIFHTSNKNVWDFVNKITPFKPFINSPLAWYGGKLYNLPFNMNTFYQLWGCSTPSAAMAMIEMQKELEHIDSPKNLEEQALNLVGRDIYEKLVKGYTEKQWGCNATELPPFIIKRLPVRFTYDNNYFNDIYQGIPIGGYNNLIKGLLGDTEVLLETDYFGNRGKWDKIADKIVFTGRIDEYYDFKFGKLNYRSLRFEHNVVNIENVQGNAVINYTEREVPFTRIIEHKHFENLGQKGSVITHEYPENWEEGKEPYYPINNEENNILYEKYKELSQSDPKVIFGGRLGEYKYYDMHQIVEQLINIEP